jgi:hypothetical protein
VSVGLLDEAEGALGLADELPCEASADPEEAASLSSDAMALLADDMLVALIVLLAGYPF